MNPPLVETKDYYINESGWVVLTESFLLARGVCCGNGCKHCPYDYMHVKDTQQKQILLEKRNSTTN